MQGPPSLRSALDTYGTRWFAVGSTNGMLMTTAFGSWHGFSSVVAETLVAALALLGFTLAIGAPRWPRLFAPQP